MSGGENFYRILGVAQGADQITIRRTYQRLARRLHPSLHPGDRKAERRFKVILRAYRFLSDPARRRRYDHGEVLSTALRSEPLRRRPTLSPRDLAGQLEELVVELVHIGEPDSAASAVVKGVDTEAEVNLDLAEAVRGVTTSISIQVDVPCSDCAGRGSTDGEICQACEGRGVLIELERIRVRIPAGIDDGGRLLVRGRGSPGADGSTRGDLYLVAKIRPHTYFRRRGADIHAGVPLTVREAALGAEIEVPTIDGPVRLTIPAGTDSGQVFRLRGKGVTLPSGRRGDHYCTAYIVAPPVPDRETRELLDRLQEQNPRRDLPREGL